MYSLVAPLILGLTALSAAAPAATPSWATQSWDVIVVGAGPAGIIVADRMSEAGKKTLLLEGGSTSYAWTGGTASPKWLDGSGLSRVDVPGLYKSIFADQGDLTCENVTNAFGGCTIGGSSAVNAGLFFQPPASDFDLYFPKGWKSTDVQGAITKLKLKQGSGDITSQNGKRYLQSGYNVAKEWLVNGAGYKSVNINTAANDKSMVFGHPIFNYVQGQRGGPAVTYLKGSVARNNFHLAHSTRVKHVVHNGRKATGVVAMVNGKATTIKLTSSGRIILSGGALQSPQILMYSGIGDPATLTKLKSAGIVTIPSTQWINNTAIGDRLFDNPNTFIELQSPDAHSYVYEYTNPPTADKNLYLDHRSGPYSFASETSAFWDQIKHSNGDLVGLQGTIDSSGYSDYTNNHTITLNIYGTSGLLSSGKVILDNDKFLPGPSKDVYYSNPRDADDIATFIKSIFEKMPANLTPLNIKKDASHADIVKYITTPSAYAVGMVNHWSSSCRFGKCVDTNTKVVGTSNVHVVDGSIVPPLTVNPQMGIMIAAERASELILKL